MRDGRSACSDDQPDGRDVGDTHRPAGRRTHRVVEAEDQSLRISAVRRSTSNEWIPVAWPSDQTMASPHRPCISALTSVISVGTCGPPCGRNWTQAAHGHDRRSSVNGNSMTIPSSHSTVTPDDREAAIETTCGISDDRVDELGVYVSGWVAKVAAVPTVAPAHDDAPHECQTGSKDTAPNDHDATLSVV